MTKKSDSRLARDAKRREQLGITPKVRIDREKNSRSWYELKMTHKKSQDYIERTAKLFGQYNNAKVILQIVRNGKQDRWNELQKLVQEKMEVFGPRFKALWDSHKDKRKLCLSFTELTQAFQIFEAYQVFNMDFYNEFEPIIAELNEIFNEALKQLLDGETDPKVVTDVDYREPAAVQEPPKAEELGDLGNMPEQQPAAADDAKVDADPATGAELIRPEL